MRVLLLVLLAGCAAAPDEGNLPVASHGLPRSTATPRIDLHLSAKGELTEKGRALSLDGLSVRLKRLRQPDLGPASVSDVTCVIHADREAAWGHIQWILTVCAEELTGRIEFVYEGGGVIPVRLPEDRAISWKLGEPDGQILKLFIGVEADGRYLFGEQRSSDLRAVSGWMGLARDPKYPGVVAEIRASPRARWGAVAGLLDRLDAAGIKQIEFFGCEIPTRKERALRTLAAVSRGRIPRYTGALLLDACRREDGRWDYGEPEPILDDEGFEEPPLDEEGPFGSGSSD
jgi:biopolymer transport protein ExbD